MLFNILPNAKGFSKEHDQLYFPNGLRKDKKGQTEEDLNSHGGSLQELELFIKNAMDSAEAILNTNTITRYLTPVSRQQTVKTTKRKNTTDDKFKDEVKDKEGIERRYSSSFTGSIDVNIDLLEIDPVLQTQVRFFHVQGLKSSMRMRFDPSLLCIVVRPANLEKHDPNKPECSQYYVIQGVNSFKAVSELKKEGKIHLLKGINSGLLTVTVVNVEDIDLIHYGHLRGNSLASAFIKKPGPQVCDCN